MRSTAACHSINHRWGPPRCAPRIISRTASTEAAELFSGEFHMRVLRVACCVCLFGVLGGCAVYTPGGAVVVVDPEPRANGNFCPPGQAKKGRC